MNFDRWRRWGIDLDDASFANAWIALGLVAHRNRTFTPDQARQELWAGPTIDWAFPSEELQVKGSPEEWADVWKDMAVQIPRPFRLRVLDAPSNELILPWYRTLTQADPAPSAISLRIEPPRAQLHIDWPLRIGFLSENSESVVEQVMAKWPSTEVAKSARLDRVSSNCDVLVHKSSARELLQQLLQQPFSIKADIIVLQGADDVAWGEIDSLLATVLTLTRASGFVLVPPTLDDADLASMLNRMVREFTHDMPIDAALGESIRWKKSYDVLAAFTHEITEFSIRQLVERYNRRIEALPEGTTFDMSRVGPSGEWLTRGMRGGGMRGGEAKSMAPPGADDRHVKAHSVQIDADELGFESEREGGSALAQVSRAMETASVPVPEMTVRAARFLQQKSFVRVNSEFQDAKDGFIAGVPAMIRVRIAAPEEGWDSLPTEFPVEKLPQHLEKWKLTVWLTELDHLAEPLKERIDLPRDGNSTECEFHFRPGTEPRFNGRITVLYRGRIIQTAILEAGVRAIDESFVDDATPKLRDLVAVRNRVGDLDQRRQFDFAFVANHDSKGRPLLTGVSDKAAWVKDTSEMEAIATEINKLLLPVAKAVADYVDGLRGEKGRELLVKLAQQGEWLKTYLNVSLDSADNNLKTTYAEYLQIVSTRPHAVVPLEFLYEHTVPDDDAKVCPHWLNAPKNEELNQCAATCDTTSGHFVCPLGFWGLRKVIERHAVTPGLAKDGNVLYLQSEPTRQSDTLYLRNVVVLGSSERVPKKNVTDLEKLLNEHGVSPKVATNWDEWAAQVQEHKPSLLIALPHTDGKEGNVTVEIGGKTVKTITLKETHIFPPPVEGRQAPLVAFIGCDIASTAAEYGSHVVALRARGAGIIIGTIATVFGEHAAEVAGKLVEGLLVPANAQPVRLGELIRTVRRNSVRDGLLMPLCLVAYGDADWILSPGEAPHV